jgi:hypothetical protein
LADLGLFAGGITLWRALRTPGEPSTAKAPSQEQAARAMDAAAAGRRHAADDLKAQVAHLSNELRAQGSGPGNQRADDAAKTPDADG